MSEGDRLNGAGGGSRTLAPGTVRAWAGCQRRASVSLPLVSKRAGRSVENQGSTPPLLSVARIGGHDAHDESVTAHHPGMADLVDPRYRIRACARSGRVSHAPLRTLEASAAPVDHRSVHGFSHMRQRQATTNEPTIQPRSLRLPAGQAGQPRRFSANCPTVGRRAGEADSSP